MIELILSKIKIDENRSEQIIVLKEREGERFLPVVIGMAEVNSIKLKLSGITPPRPLTHDLLLNILQQLDTELDHILIDKLENNTFYAKLVLQRNGERLIVDARPSDSVALALRAGTAIFVEEDVMDKAGIL